MINNSSPPNIYNLSPEKLKNNENCPPEKLKTQENSGIFLGIYSIEKLTLKYKLSYLNQEIGLNMPQSLSSKFLWTIIVKTKISKYSDFAIAS